MLKYKKLITALSEAVFSQLHEMKSTELPDLIKRPEKPYDKYPLAGPFEGLKDELDTLYTPKTYIKSEPDPENPRKVRASTPGYTTEEQFEIGYALYVDIIKKSNLSKDEKQNIINKSRKFTSLAQIVNNLAFILKTHESNITVQMSGKHAAAQFEVPAFEEVSILKKFRRSTHDFEEVLDPDTYAGLTPEGAFEISRELLLDAIETSSYFDAYAPTEKDKEKLITLVTQDLNKYTPSSGVAGVFQVAEKWLKLAENVREMLRNLFKIDYSRMTEEEGFEKARDLFYDILDVSNIDSDTKDHVFSFLSKTSVRQPGIVLGAVNRLVKKLEFTESASIAARTLPELIANPITAPGHLEDSENIADSIVSIARSQAKRIIASIAIFPAEQLASLRRSISTEVFTLSALEELIDSLNYGTRLTAEEIEGEVLEALKATFLEYVAEKLGRDHYKYHREILSSRAVQGLEAFENYLDSEFNQKESDPGMSERAIRYKVTLGGVSETLSNYFTDQGYDRDSVDELLDKLSDAIESTDTGDVDLFFEEYLPPIVGAPEAKTIYGRIISELRNSIKVAYFGDGSPANRGRRLKEAIPAYEVREELDMRDTVQDLHEYALEILGPLEKEYSSYIELRSGALLAIKDLLQQVITYQNYESKLSKSLIQEVGKLRSIKEAVNFISRTFKPSEINMSRVVLQTKNAVVDMIKSVLKRAVRRSDIHGRTYSEVVGYGISQAETLSQLQVILDSLTGQDTTGLRYITQAPGGVDGAKAAFANLIVSARGSERQKKRRLQALYLDSEDQTSIKNMRSLRNFAYYTQLKAEGLGMGQVQSGGYGR